VSTHGHHARPAGVRRPASVCGPVPAVDARYLDGSCAGCPGADRDWYIPDGPGTEDWSVVAVYRLSTSILGASASLQAAITGTAGFLTGYPAGGTTCLVGWP